MFSNKPLITWIQIHGSIYYTILPAAGYRIFTIILIIKRHTLINKQII